VRWVPLLALALLGCKNDGLTAYNDCTEELCNGLDDDCDGLIDEEATDQTVWYTDEDRDGWGYTNDSVLGCESPGEGYADQSGDCDDEDPRFNPGADEDDCTDPTDYNCDGLDPFDDADADGFPACEECDDADRDVSPGAAEVCNGVDDDCDDEVDDDPIDAEIWYADADGDGFGDAANDFVGCDQPEGYVVRSGDCDDGVDTVHPGADEVCDGVDQDCDGTADEDATDAITWYADSDKDGYGDPLGGVLSCDQPSGYVADRSDCDDTNRRVSPGADERCNGGDDDCDGDVDEDAIDMELYAADADGDGFGDAGSWALACDGADNDDDCDDTDPSEPVVVDQFLGSSSGAGTLASPLNTIQPAVDRATQCVFVYEGTYTEAVDFGGTDLLVVGMDGADRTTIEASGTGSPAVTFAGGETAAAELRGFTLRGDGHLEESSVARACDSTTVCTDWYQVYCGGGLYVEGADPTLADLVVDGSSLPASGTSIVGADTYYVESYGGGACFVDAAPTLSGVDIQENFADQGGGLWADETSDVTITQSWIVANSATDGGGLLVETGTVRLTNVALTWNDASDSGGGALIVDGRLIATNVTFGADDAVDGGGIYASGAARLTMNNTIVYGAATGVGVLADSTANVSARYSDVYANAGGQWSGVSDPTGTNGNITGDPDFTSVSYDGNAWNDNWALLVTSACWDAGDPALTDPDGTQSDMGAFGGPDGGW
jgi:hypothetical protein